MTAPTAATRTTEPLRRDAARNRERLLAAAQQVFAEQGLGAGVEEVARVAGVGMGTLYRRFPTKDALIDALVEALRQRLLELAEAAARIPDGLGLERFLESFGSVQAGNHGLLARLWTYDYDDPTISAQRRAMSRLLRDAQRHGRVRAELCETDVTILLWAMRGVVETTRDVAPDAWRRHLEIMLAGMRPADPPLMQKRLSPARVRAVVST